MTRRDLFKFALTSLPLAATRVDQVASLSLNDARPILDEFSAELPGALRAGPLTEASWLDWESAHDKEIRSRLKRGDADSIVNLVLFGTSFTARPRFAPGEVPADSDSESIRRLMIARVEDFSAAVLRPQNNERLQFAAQWLKDMGAGQTAQAVGEIILDNAQRVLREQREYNRAIAEAKKKGDASSVFVERSSLYRDRGLSLDTSFRPNLAIERSLGEMKKAAILTQVKRAAIIGPGLDFTDKRSGYDFYPVQTLQPFALIDSLRRLGLADAPQVEILDLSDRVLNHVRNAAGGPYTVQIPLDGDTKWLPSSVDYWRKSCAEIGTEIKPFSPPQGTEVRMRAVRISPEIVRLLHPSDLDIVIEHMVVPKFDVIVATNILVYYSQFEQALALQNVARMLRPQGILLTNNALPEVAGVPMHPAGATSVAYSEDPDDGDHVLWYRRG
jgi:hypothetical protein